MIVCITWLVMCYNVVCLVISTWMSERNILEKYLECTVYKTGTKRINENKLEEFIWFRGEEI